MSLQRANLVNYLKIIVDIPLPELLITLFLDKCVTKNETTQKWGSVLKQISALA